MSAINSSKIKNSSTAGDVHTGVFEINYQTISCGADNATIAVATVTYDSWSSGEYPQSTGTPLADAMVADGLLCSSTSVAPGTYIVVTSGGTLEYIASNFASSASLIGRYHGQIIGTSEAGAILVRITRQVDF